MELLEKCREMIKRNLKTPTDENTLDILTYAIFAIILTKEEITISKMPNILQELDIYAENKKVIDIAHEKLTNYSEDQLINHCDACVTRALNFDNEGNFTQESRSLLLSLNNKNSFDLIINIIHEFIHLLRFGGVIQSDDNYKIKDGICVAYYNSTTNSLKRKHYNLEEGIVQYYTNIAIKNLADYLKENKIDTPIANNYSKEIKKHKFTDYLIQTSIINALCNDNTFKALIDNTFTDNNIPVQAITYYNDVLTSSCAFTDLSKKVDTLSNYINTPNPNQQEILMQYEKIKELISKFLIKCRKKSNK